jgi:5-methyltetrahydrofolate--homocysteine methyltransferase
VVQKLLDEKKKADFVGKVAAEYDRLRDAHEERQAAQQLVPIEVARWNRFRSTGATGAAPPPNKLGIQVLADYDLEEIAKYIDWSPFFHAWELRGTFPKILEDRRWGEKAREVFEDGKMLLEKILHGRLLKASAVFGLFPARSVGEDVEIYADDSESEPLTVFHFLRQQILRDSDKPNLCLADFIEPKDSFAADFIGAFAVTTGIGLDEIVRRFEKDHDDYNAIMAKALADRLAEAFAESLHCRIRRDYWGYAAEETLAPEELIAESYRGIRPAPGYPACPDHTEKQILFDLLAAGENAGIELTENFAMAPAASVSGFYFAHPEARYFSLGKIGRDQVADYALRKGMTLGEIERWLSPNLGYDPEKESVAVARE